MATLDQTANALALLHSRREGRPPWLCHATAFAEARSLAVGAVVLLPAEVVDVYTQPSTSGAVVHVATSCPARHHLVETVS